MNAYEMEGFLRGKCLPGDLLVGESNAAYLVRKLNEAAALKADRDAQQKRADALAVRNEQLMSFVVEVFNIAAQHCTLNREEIHDLGERLELFGHEAYQPVLHGYHIGLEAGESRVYVIKNQPADAALAAIEARFCGLLDTYGKVEPERFNPEFADLYAKIVNRIFSSVMDNPSVTDLESLTDWLENSAENARAYADMSIKFHAELREAK